MPQPRRPLNALPAVAAAAAAVALSSGCATSATTGAEEHPSITFGSQAGPTPGLVGQGTMQSPTPTASSAPESHDPPVPLPGAGEPVAFERNIKPLFREEDRTSMKFAFDLWSYNDVRTHAAAIVDRLRDGSMPCDGAWSADKVAVFQRWIDTGMAA